MPKKVYLLSDVSVAPVGDGLRQFSGIANSGQPFLHYGERTVVDFDGIKFHDKVPVLMEHDRSRRCGFGALSVENHQLLIHGSLLDNEFGQEVADDADAGFPWQMSAHVHAGRVESLAEGQTVVVNGASLTAPLVILRQCRVSEVSFTPTGVDNQTSAVLLSEEEEMTLEELQKKVASLEQQLTEKSQKIANLEQENETLKASSQKADVDKKLSLAGFKQDQNGQFCGVSHATYQVLLSQSAEHVDALIADLKPKAVPEFLLSETVTGDVPLSEFNPLMADLERRK